VSGSKVDDVSENVPFSIFSLKWEMKNLPRSVLAGLVQKLVVSHVHTQTDRQMDGEFLRNAVSFRAEAAKNVQNKRCLILHNVAELFEVEKRCPVPRRCSVE